MHSRFDHIALRGFCGAVPSKIVTIDDLVARSSKDDKFKLKRVAFLAGLKQRHVTPPNMFVGDLAAKASWELLQHLKWSSETIDALFFITQSPDFLSPPTGYLIAAYLGLDEHCAILDITAGCSGMIHGLWIASGHVSPECRRVLLLTGDTATKCIPQEDIGNTVLMGDGVGAVALEYDTKAPPLSFHLLSKPDTSFSLTTHNSGYRFRDINSQAKITRMDGNKVTDFCLEYVPRCMLEHVQKENISIEDIDVFFLHQPNKSILDTIQQRLGLKEEKIPKIVADYANCSSASLAINVCVNAFKYAGTQLSFFCGFGSGLSVASLLAQWNPTSAFPLATLERGGLLFEKKFEGTHVPAL